MVVRMCVAMLLVMMSGCVRERPHNPAFMLTTQDATLALEEMSEAKLPLERPVIVLAGFGDPGLAAAEIATRLRRTTTNPELISSVAFFFEPTIDSARDATIRHALNRYAAGDPERLASMEFDLVGFSMGGLVARLTAMENEPGLPPLSVRRVWTIGTPHRGAKAAVLPSFDRKVLAMRSGSEFLRRLDRGLEDATYELVCYTRLGDGMVGEENASPSGHPLIWMPNEPYRFAHLGAGADARILADIARRLRNEVPYADPRGAPIPGAEGE